MNNFFSKIGFVNLYTPEKERMITFYRDILGMKPQVDQSESSHWYGFTTGETTFAIEPLSNRDQLKKKGIEINSNVLIQFLVDSEEELENANQYLEAKGIQLITRSQKTQYGTFSNFLDPDGNLVEILVIQKNS